MNMLTPSSEWIFNPMQYTGIYTCLGKHIVSAFVTQNPRNMSPKSVIYMQDPRLSLVYSFIILNISPWEEVGVGGAPDTTS